MKDDYYTMSADSKPISLADFTASLKDLPEDSIQSVQASLELSLAKLQETNDYLSAEIPATTDASDLRIYKETIDENLETMKNQKKKLEAVSAELSSRGVAPDTEAEGILL